MKEMICFKCGGKAIPKDNMTVEINKGDYAAIVDNVKGFECTECGAKIYNASEAEKIEKSVPKQRRQQSKKAA